MRSIELALDATPVAMLLVRSDGSVKFMNRHAESLFGYGRGELIGEPIEHLVPRRYRPAHQGFRTGFAERPEARPMGGGRDLFAVRKDGEEVPVEIGLSPLETPQGSFIVCSVINLTERKRHEASLEASLREKETLLREVHHRVKNNLQVFSSLLRLMATQAKSPETQSALGMCQDRIQSIALVHEQLYRAHDLARVTIDTYLEQLVVNLFRASGASERSLSLAFRPGSAVLTVEEAIPCGLITNELVTNALKHAFPNDRAGTLTVGLSEAASFYELVVSDDGIGLGQSIDPDSTTGLGLVHMFARQLHAELVIDNQTGTTFTIRFPKRSS